MEVGDGTGYDSEASGPVNGARGKFFIFTFNFNNCVNHHHNLTLGSFALKNYIYIKKRDVNACYNMAHIIHCMRIRQRPNKFTKKLIYNNFI